MDKAQQTGMILNTKTANMINEKSMGLKLDYNNY